MNNNSNLIIFNIFLFFSNHISCGEVKSWECYKFENSKIYGESGDYLGSIGPSWLPDSIFNSSNQYSSTWSQESIFNTNSKYGSSYSAESAFNEGASNPPKVYKDGELIGFLSVGP